MLNIQNIPALLLGLAILAILGCQEGDNEALWWNPPSVLALDSHYELTVLDACRSRNAKILMNLCSTDTVVSIDIAVAEDLTVLEVVPVSEAPEELGLPVDPATMAVHAIGEGETTLTVSATFDDGTHREMKYELAVRKPNNLRVLKSCDNGDGRNDENLHPIQVETSFGVSVLDGDGELDGALLDVIQSDASESQVWYGFGRIGEGMTVSLPAQETAGSLTLVSPFVPSFSHELEFYGPEQVTQYVVLPETWSSERLDPEDPHTLDIVTRVGERLPCTGMPPDVTSLTPEICANRDQSPRWTAARSSVTLYGFASGRCVLELAPPGAPAVTTFAIDIVTLSPTEIALRNAHRARCFVEENVKCSQDKSGIVVCHEGTWQVPTRNGENVYCSGDTTCHFRALNGTSCAYGEGCVDCR